MATTINNANDLQKQYESFIAEENSPVIAKNSQYLYPTLITLPIVVALIIIIASNTHISIKIIVVIILIIALTFYALEKKDVDLLKYIKRNKSMANKT